MITIDLDLEDKKQIILQQIEDLKRKERNVQRDDNKIWNQPRISKYLKRFDRAFSVNKLIKS